MSLFITNMVGSECPPAEVDVQEENHPPHPQRGGLSFILKKNRESLQGRAKLTKGAQSATMIYSYKYILARRAVIATLERAFKADHWLKNPLNVIQLHLCETVVA